MGDAKSWFILVMGAFAILAFLVVLLIAIIVGFISLLRQFSSRDERKWKKDASSDTSPAMNTSSGQYVYNFISDTIAGLNMRKSDNLFQATFILFAVLVSTALGSVFALLKEEWELPWFGGALIGAFAGLVIGFFASGMILMVYRAVRHMLGKHE